MKRKKLNKFLICKYKKIEYIKSENNNGYGSGNNIGVNVSKGKYILFLNPDCKVMSNTLQKLSDFLDKNINAAVVAPNLINENGKLFYQLGSRELTPLRGIVALSFINKLFPNNPISRKYFMHDIPMTKLREADAVPGSAFMIRSDVFKKIGGFDEKIFMYFEESDLGKRVKGLGYKIYIIPYAEVVHKWNVNKKNEKLQRIFEKSRFYYFKKHFGVLKAMIVELFCRISIYDLLFLLLFLIGSFLRFYNSQNTLAFNSELANVYLEIKNYIISGNIPLVGPATSHPWLRFGPLYYWLMIPIFYITKFDPLYISYFMKGISLFVIIFNYYFIKILINKRISIISTLFVTISPALITLANSSMLFSIIPVLFYPFLYLLISFKGDIKRLILIFLLLSVLLNFHFTAMIYIPTILILMIFNKRKLRLKSIVASVLIFFIPFVPVLISDYRNNFDMIKNFAVWIPYRLLGFTGIIHKNNFTITVLLNNLKSFYIFITSMFLSGGNYLNIIMFLIFILCLLISFRKTIRDNYKININFILLLLITTGYVSLFIHGNPPWHYYLPLFTIPFLIIANSLNYMKSKFIVFIIIFSILISFNDIKYYFSYNWFYRTFENNFTNQVSFFVQKDIVSYIISDSKGLPISIKRIGQNDDFEKDFAANYQYLLWLYGNEPVRVGNVDINNKKPVIEYKIYEVFNNRSFNEGDDLVNVDGVYIKKTII